MTSKNLVIVRAGENSHHQTWGKSENWDLLVSYYGTDPDKYKNDGIGRIDGYGGKLGDLYNLWNNHPEVFKDREYIWSVDDDVEITSENIDKMFFAMKKYDIDLGQPSLSLDGYVNHRITAQHEQFILRYVTMVETMIPCFSIGLLEKLIPIFKDVKFGWGVDHIWSRYARENKSVIFDQITCKHCRPQGTGELYHSGEPILEMKDNMKKLNCPALPRPTTYMGLSLDNNLVRNDKLNELMIKSESIIIPIMNDTAKKVKSHTRPPRPWKT